VVPDCRGGRKWRSAILTLDDLKRLKEDIMPKVDAT